MQDGYADPHSSKENWFERSNTSSELPFEKIMFIMRCMNSAVFWTTETRHKQKVVIWYLLAPIAAQESNNSIRKGVVAFRRRSRASEFEREGIVNDQPDARHKSTTMTIFTSQLGLVGWVSLLALTSRQLAVMHQRMPTLHLSTQMNSNVKIETTTTTRSDSSTYLNVTNLHRWTNVIFPSTELLVPATDP